MRRRPRVRVSLFAKYLAVLTAMVAVPLVTAGLVDLYFTYQDSKDALSRLQHEKARSVATTVEQFVERTRQDLDRAAGADLTPQRRALLLRLLLRLPSPAEDVVYLNGAGRDQVHLSLFEPDRFGAGMSYRRQPFFRQARASGVYYSDPYDRGNERGDDPLIVGSRDLITPKMLISAAEEYPGKGVVAAVVDLAVLRSLISRTRLGDSGYAYAVDRRGRPVAHPNADVFGRGGTKLVSLPQVQAALAARDRGESTTIGRDRQGRKVLSASVTVPSIGWHVFVEEPLSEAFAPLRSAIKRGALLLLLFLLAAAGASYLLARRLTRPVKTMQAAAARIGAGAYSERIEISRSDELGALADELNGMAASLEQSYANLEEKVDDRTRELQRTLAELAEKSRQLEVSSRHKNEFLANMSHELRTPLNAILGFSQVLRERFFGEINEKQEEYLDDVISSANHLLSLINDVLDLSKVEAGQVELEIAEFSLREALDRGLVMVRERAAKNGVALQLETDPSAHIVEGDERRVRQVIFNLLSNAVKFTPAGGRVDVSTTRFDGEVRVAVRDSGPGVAVEDRERIFEAFQQATVGSERPEGTGLGLALSRRLVEAHGGRLWLDSEVGTGSTFTFTIPLATGSEGAA